MTDIELINRVKEHNDSAALVELIERNSGMYVKMVNRYAAIEKTCGHNTAKLDTHELEDDKALNIYNFARTYDPNRNMKFSTYVGEMTRYLCLDLLNNRHVLADNSVKAEVTEETPITAQDTESRPAQDNTLESIRARTKGINDDIFWSIFDLRHFKDGGGYTWRTIGERVGLTHEGARQIYNRNIKHIKYYLIK